jgi:hypothetical protein
VEAEIFDFGVIHVRAVYHDENSHSVVVPSEEGEDFSGFRRLTLLILVALGESIINICYVSIFLP